MRAYTAKPKSPLAPPTMGAPKMQPKSKMAPAAKGYASRARRAMGNLKAGR